MDKTKLLVTVVPPVPRWVYDTPDDLNQVVLAAKYADSAMPPDGSEPLCTVNICIPGDGGTLTRGPWKFLDAGELTVVDDRVTSRPGSGNFRPVLLEGTLWQTSLLTQQLLSSFVLPISAILLALLTNPLLALWLAGFCAGGVVQEKWPSAIKLGKWVWILPCILTLWSISDWLPRVSVLAAVKNVFFPGPELGKTGVGRTCYISSALEPRLRCRPGNRRASPKATCQLKSR